MGTEMMDYDDHDDIATVLVRFPQRYTNQHKVGGQLLRGVSLRDVKYWWRRRRLDVRLSRQILKPVLDCRVVLMVD